MRLYSGNVADKAHVACCRDNGWGRMISPAHWRDPDLLGLPWAFDNGAYRAFTRREPFDVETFVRQYSRTVEVTPPDFAVVPDIVGGGFESLRFSLSHVDTMWWEVPSYLAVQDGMSRQVVEPVLHFFDGIFVGGSSSTNRFGNRLDVLPERGRSRGWKWDTARDWVDLAHSRGLKCHIGKVGTFHDIIQARLVGADSIDSTSWSVNDTHWVAELAMGVNPRIYPLPIRGLAMHDECGFEVLDDDWGNGVCRLKPRHEGDHEPAWYYDGMAPLLARDRGPGDW